VLTKLDGTAKGGIIFAIQKEVNIPVKLIGIGEGVEDLRDFDPAISFPHCSSNLSRNLVNSDMDFNREKFVSPLFALLLFISIAGLCGCATLPTVSEMIDTVPVIDEPLK